LKYFGYTENLLPIHFMEKCFTSNYLSSLRYHN
jgi:hypothetical protein